MIVKFCNRMLVAPKMLTVPSITEVVPSPVSVTLLIPKILKLGQVPVNEIKMCPMSNAAWMEPKLRTGSNPSAVATHG